MVITETQLRNDTKGDQWGVILEKAFSEVFKKTLYIFISHKHNEENHVYRLQEILKRYGFAGYVDWEDEDMPPTTSGETALRLKERIVKSKKFILIATEAAIESKWCNWEIGFADAHKYEDHLALFPIKGDYGNYKGEEYLQIYPSIQIRRVNLETSLEYYIKYPNGNELSMKTWLTL
jgi:hypothetical protein